MSKKDPIDEAIEAGEQREREKTAAAKKRDADDLALYEAWKADPTPTTMRPLMSRFEPIFKSKDIAWRAPTVNPQTFRTKAQNLTVQAIQDYDPTHPKGAALRSWVETRLQPLKRLNVEQQNYAKIPEAKAARIGDINAATDELRDESGGLDPTPDQIAEHVNPQLSTRQQLTGAKVQQIQQAQRKDVIGSTFESDPVPRAISRERQIISQLRPTLDPAQQEVYDYLYGQGGKPKVTSTSQLAKLLKKSPSQVSRLRTAILNKYKEYE